MNEDIIQCRDRGTVMSSEPWKPGQIVNFMWMPSGVHTIVAGFRKGSIELTVQCDESTVDAVQASLDGWRAERPKQECFGCVEHAEREASFRVGASCGFNWKQDGVYLTAEPTVLGAQNINGKIHRSWSPSFTTDAEYSKATEQNGVLVFPEGARGSRSNPARITGCDFCVGTITNRPAFHEIAPVKAREAGDAVTAGAPLGNKNAAGKHEIAGAAANDATKVAWSTDSDKDHDAAMVAHADASSAMLKAGKVKMADYHARMAAHHESQKSGFNKATDPTLPDSVRAHCRLTLLQDVPDATDAEVAQYEKEVEGGGSHADAVIKLRSARQNGFKTTGSEKPTIDTIAAKHAAAVEAANRIAAEHGAAKLTAAEVYERFSVKAEQPKDDATPEAILERIYARAGANR